MISFLKSLLLLSLSFGTYPGYDVTFKKVTCNELGLSFKLPEGFISLDSKQMDALSRQGEKAVKESFDKEIIKGWQPVCVNMQDSFKRTVVMQVISINEAIVQNGTIDKFIDKTFKDGNDFIIQRFRSKANIEIEETEAVEQTQITIAGFKVRKNAFTFLYGTRLLFFARYYFFQRNGKLYLLGFTGSPKANDNEDIVSAIESAEKI